MSFHGANLATPSRVRRTSDTPCAHCGATPTMDESFETRVGGLVTEVTGPFCRDCGIATFRLATAKTLVKGWWGPVSFLLTPVTVLGNLGGRRRASRLVAPQNPTGGRQPMSIGRSLWVRWQIVGVFTPLLLVAAIILAVGQHIHNEHVAVTRNLGRCIQFQPDTTTVFVSGTIVSCDQPHHGRIVSDVQAYNQCPAGESAFNAQALNVYYCVTPDSP